MVIITGFNGAFVKSSAVGLVGTGFTSQIQFRLRAGFKGSMGRCKATTPSSLSLTSNSNNGK